jgi:hypothetical protein
LQSCKLDVQFLELQGALKNSSKLILVLDEMVEDVAEETIEDNQGRVNLGLLLSLDKLEQEIEEFLPDAVILFSNHRSLNFDRNIADLVHESFVGGIN